MTGLTRRVALSAAALAIPTASHAASLNAEAILQRIKAAGLPIGSILAYTARTDPNKMLGRPNGYLSKADFTDSRYPDLETAGTLEVFASPDLVERRQRYIDSITEMMPGLTQYMYRHRSMLLRIERDLLPDEAQAYETAMKAIRL